MIELNGSLGGIGLSAVISLLSELRETGVLRLSEGAWNGELAFDEGTLISATLGTTRGLDALTACVLMLGNSEFQFVEATTDVDRNISLSTDQLRRHLEQLPATSGEQHPPVPSLDVVPRPANDSNGSAAAEELVLDRTAMQVLVLVDGQRTVREIIGERPIVPVLRSLAQLAQHGLIKIEEGTPATAAALLPVAPGPSAEVPTADANILGTCPLLGYADDRDRHYSRPTALHRCYATEAPSLISSQDQRDLCFGGRNATCPRYQAAVHRGEPTSETIAVPRGMPAGVAARLAAAQSMKLAGPAADEVPAWLGAEAAAPRKAPAPVRPARPRIGGRFLIAGGAVLGLIVIAAVLMVLPLLFQPQLVQPLPTPAVGFTAVPATAAPPRPTEPLAVLTSVLTQPTNAPTRLATATTVATLASALLDIRFAAGPRKEWLENLPFVGWRDGAYRLTANQAKRFVAVAAPLIAPDDVVVSATLRKTGGPPGGGYGVILRNQVAESLNGINQTFDGYVLETGDLGEFGIWRREGDRWVDLVPWSRSQAVRQGGSPNEISVRATGTVLAFTINGIEVARVDDGVLSHGGVGVFAGGDNNEVALDRFTVQIPN